MQYQVLICDDSRLGRRSVNRCLPEGFAESINEAANGQEALDLLRTQKIDVLFLDLTMPVLDGVGVLEAILIEKIAVSVIVVSGDVQPQMQQKVVELGALDFIAKPLDTQKLGQVLAKWELA